MYNANRLKLGLFGFNCDGGMAITAAPERWRPSWENNVEVARLADEAGLEFLLPIGRWRGYGGKANFQGVSFETMTWACGLLSCTTRCTVFGTIHAPLFHPIVAAKQMATVDAISGGRFGLNLVCGWNEDEFEMFGQAQREHDERYEYGDEWLEVVRTVWREQQPVDFRGRYFDLPGLIGRPSPHGGGEPVLMNAGYSSAGRAFAERNCEFLLTSLIDVDSGRRDVDEVRAAARRGYGRDIRVIATAYVVCRPTRAEAEEFHDYYANEHADWEAADHLMELAGVHAKFFPPEHYQLFRERFAGGHGMYPIVGDPDLVADELERVAEAGFAGAAISFVDYVGEFPYFRDEVLPRLDARGLRSRWPSRREPLTGSAGGATEARGRRSRMPETVTRGGKTLTIYDLSDCLSNDTSAFEFNKHHIEYISPEQTAKEFESSFGIGPEHWPGGVAASAEVVTLSTHAGTHVDAPAHYGPAAVGTARTIDEIPLSWCFGDGVLLDMTRKSPVDGVSRADVEAELGRIGYTLKAGDIVLVMTGASRRFREPGYEQTHAGLRRDATEFMVDQGVRLIGIDGWGIDRAFDVMIEEAKAGKVQFWESHLLGREKEYCQIERLANLDQLPRPFGFTVYAFPYKLERASASWARVVAIFEDEVLDAPDR